MRDRVTFMLVTVMVLSGIVMCVAMVMCQAASNLASSVACGNVSFIALAVFIVSSLAASVSVG